MKSRLLQSITLTSLLIAGCAGDSVPQWRFTGPSSPMEDPRGPHPEPTPCFSGACSVPAYQDHPCTDDSVCHPPAYCELDLSHIGEGFCVDPDKICEFTNECDLYSLEQCVAGYCTVVTPEVCDGLDNDRDGIADGLAPRVCYTGAPETRNIGLCRDGVQVCSGGTWSECAGDKLPLLEEHILLCDGQDNDCDGCADNTYDDVGRCVASEPKQYDLILIVDVSGSMQDDIGAVIMASTGFAGSFEGNPDFRFALLTHPARIDEADFRVSLELPFSDYSALREGLDRVWEYASDWQRSAAEQSYDIPHMVATGAYSTLTFRERARRVYISFTDEGGQSNPFLGFPHVSEEMMCDALRPDDAYIVVTSSAIARDFSCARQFELTTDPAQMAEKLRAGFTSVCGQYSLTDTFKRIE